MTKNTMIKPTLFGFEEDNPPKSTSSNTTEELVKFINDFLDEHFYTMLKMAEQYQAGQNDFIHELFQKLVVPKYCPITDTLKP